jgi:RecA/RadA recombinase
MDDKRIAQRLAVMKSLGMQTFLKPSKKFIDIGDAEMNGVFGSKSKGVPSGKVTEIAGPNHAGKTLWALILSVLAQQQHKAKVFWIDLEETWDDSWAELFGLDLSDRRFYLIQPLVVKFAAQDKGTSKKAKSRKAGRVFLQTIEWNFRELEAAMAQFKEEYPDRPIVVVCDSIANMIVEEAEAAGATEQTMSTQQKRAAWLSAYLPRLVGLMANYDGWLNFINQIRDNPMAFGADKESTPGGKAVAHNAHCRVGIKKLKGGKLMQNGKPVGIKGKIINKKNKTGNKSVAYRERGFQIRWDRLPNLKKALKFSDIKEAEKD